MPMTVFMLVLVLLLFLFPLCSYIIFQLTTRIVIMMPSLSVLVFLV